MIVKNKNKIAEIDIFITPKIIIFLLYFIIILRGNLLIFFVVVVNLKFLSNHCINLSFLYFQIY